MAIIDALFDVGVEKRATLADVDNFLDFLASGPTSASGVKVTEKTALRHGPVFACVKVLSETVGTLPLFVYKRLKPRGKERAPTHWLYTLIHDAPNPEMTSVEYREAQMVHLALWGNHYSFIEKNQVGRVKGLWPMLPNKMAVERKKGQLIYLYEQTLDTGEIVRVQYRPDEIWHIRGMGGDGIIGYSPIRQCAETIGLSMATQEFGARFFSNDARPSLVLKYPGKLQDDAHKRLIKSWQKAYSGLANKHKAALLEENMDIKEIGIPPQDAQFLETRKFQRSDIAGMFRIPPHKIGDLERATFSNIEEQNIDFVQDGIMPWVIRIETSINSKFLGARERLSFFAEHLLDGLLRGNTEQRYGAYATARQWGWMSANDVREKENMNPIDGGDVYLIPMNMIPADGNIPLPAPIKPKEDEEEPEEEEPGKEEPEELKKKMKSLREIRSVASRKRVEQSFKRLFRDAGQRIINREGIAVKKAARKYLGKRNLNGFKSWLDEFYGQLPNYIQERMMPVILSYGEAMQAEAAQEIGTEPKVTEELQQFLKGYGDVYQKRHIASSKGQIEDIIFKTPDEELVEALEKRMDSWQEKTPDKIANRETVQAGNAVAKFEMKRAGIKAKTWKTMGTCEFCQQLQDKTVEINGTFAGQDAEISTKGKGMHIRRSIGHPPLHRACQCSIVASSLLPENEWRKSLNNPELDAFDRWQGASFDVMRDVHRGKIPAKYVKEPKMVDKIKGMLKSMDDALDRAIPYNGKVYRGLRELSKSEFDKIARMKSMNLNCLSSSSHKIKAAEAFAKNVSANKYSALFEMENKTGVRISKIFGTEQEAEVLLRKGAKYKVIGMEELDAAKYGAKRTVKIKLVEM